MILILVFMVAIAWIIYDVQKDTEKYLFNKKMEEEYRLEMSKAYMIYEDGYCIVDKEKDIPPQKIIKINQSSKATEDVTLINMEDK